MKMTNFYVVLPYMALTNMEGAWQSMDDNYHLVTVDNNINDICQQ